MRPIILLILCLFTFLPSLNAQSFSGKVISYNIWNGFDWGKDSVRHRAFTKWVSEEAPKVVALQELCGYTAHKLAEDAQAWGHAYSVLLKTEGYPVGISSNNPIEVKGKYLEGLWHGLLHVSTHDIDFFVVHLSPADLATRMREADFIAKKVKELGEKPFMILGDFNALSPMDADIYMGRPQLLDRYRKGDAKQEKWRNLRDGEFDYGVLSRFLSLPSIDVCHRLMPVEKRYSFPAPILVGTYYDDKVHIQQTHQRIDFILTSPDLAQSCFKADIRHGDPVDALSDHYPVIAEFK